MMTQTTHTPTMDLTTKSAKFADGATLVLTGNDRVGYSARVVRVTAFGFDVEDVALAVPLAPRMAALVLHVAPHHAADQLPRIIDAAVTVTLRGKAGQ